MTQKLTDSIVKTLPIPARGNRIAYDSDVKGFGVRVTAAGAVVSETVVRPDLARMKLDAILDIDLVAVTRGPGLVGALLVGVGFARGLALERLLLRVRQGV